MDDNKVNNEAEKSESSLEPQNSDNSSQVPNANNKKLVIIIGAVIGGLIVLGVIGAVLSTLIAKKGAESIIGSITKGDVKIDTGKDVGVMTIKDNEGNETTFETSGSESKLDQDFPKDDVKLYPGAKIKTSGSTKTSGGVLSNVSLVTSDSTEDVIKFYEDFFEREGWEQAYNMKTNSGVVQNYSKDSKDMMSNLTVGATNAKETSILITVTVTKDEN